MSLVLIRGPQTASCAQNVTYVLGETLIDQQQLAFHRLLVIGSHETRRPAIFAIPRMRKFVRQKIGVQQFEILIDQGPRTQAIITRLMMLEAKMSNAVAQRKQEMIAVEMMRGVELTRLKHKIMEGR